MTEFVPDRPVRGPGDAFLRAPVAALVEELGVSVSPLPAGASSLGVDPGAAEAFKRVLRCESFATHESRRIDRVGRFEQTIAGSELSQLDAVRVAVEGHLMQRRGARDRRVGSYRRQTSAEELELIGTSVDEVVRGCTTLTASSSAEAMVGGSYTNVIAGGLMRVAGWVDLLAWGGWVEIDVARVEIAALMVRSHIGYAHAALVRFVVASRLIDDFTLRTENFMMCCDTALTRVSAGGPGSGIDNAA